MKKTHLFLTGLISAVLSNSTLAELTTIEHTQFKKAIEQAEYHELYDYNNDINPDFNSILKYAQEGNIYYQHLLVAKYYLGDGIEQNFTEAAKWLEILTQKDSAKAQYLLGLMYLNNQGVKFSVEQAKKHLLKAAESGYSKAQYRLAELYFSDFPGNEQEAIKWLTTAAEQNHDEAQLKLGDLYFGGKYIPKNYTQAVKWWKKAAEQKNTSALFYLGMLYSNEDFKGWKKDRKKALHYYGLACDEGLGDGCKAYKYYLTETEAKSTK